MFPILFVSVASAASVSGGIQVAAFQSGFDFVADRFSGEVITIERDTVGAENVACYDEVGVRNLNVEVPINTVELDLRTHSIEIDIHFGLIQGQDMTIFGDDSDTFDACMTFENDFHSLEVRDARLLLEVVPDIVDGRLDLRILGNPSVNGIIYTDIDWVPDELILSVAEDAIFGAIEGAIDERLPAMVTDLVDTVAFAGELGDLAFGVEISDVEPSNSGLSLGMDVDAGWRGDGCEPPEDIGIVTGREPNIDLNEGVSADFGVAITEYQINHLFHSAWADGLLCFDSGPLSVIGDELEWSLDGPVENPDSQLKIQEAPVFSFKEDGISLRVGGLQYSARGEVNGEPVSLIDLDADLSIRAELELDHSISSFIFSLDDVQVDFSKFEVGVVLSEQQEAKDSLEALLKVWAMDTLAARIQDVPLYSNLFNAAGVFLRVSMVETAYGAVVIKGDLYNDDDPEVDTEAPDTRAELRGKNDEGILLAVEASDNSRGPFAFSTRLDSGEWSDWTSDALLTIPVPSLGTHALDVRSRDAWLNVDPSPVTVMFTVEAEPEADEKGCACASSSRSPIPWWTALVVVMMGLSRRRE